MARTLTQTLQNQDVVQDLLHNPRGFRFEGGTHIVMAADEWPPHSIITAHTPHLTISGAMANLLTILASSLNFTYTLVRPKDKSWGIRLSNGTLTGMVGMVARQEVDMALGPFAATWDRWQDVGYTTTLFTEFSMIVGACGRPEVDPWAFLLSLGPIVLIVMVAALMTVAAVVFAASSRVLPPHHHHHHTTLSDTLFKYYRILLLQDGEVRRTGWWERLVLGPWVWCGLVLASGYAGNLTSILAVRHIAQPFQTFSQLFQDQSVSIMIKPGTAEFGFIQSAEEGTLGRLAGLGQKGRLVVRKQDFQAYQSMLAGSPLVLLTEDLTSQLHMASHFSQTGRCDFYKSRETILAFSYGLIMQKNSPLVHTVNARLQQITASGLYTKWVRDAVPNFTSCNQKPTRITVKTPLNLTNFWGMFVLLCVGLTSSLITFLLELLWTWKVF